MPHDGRRAHKLRAPAAPPPLLPTPNRTSASERMAAADSLTCAGALLRCSSDLCRPAQQRHVHVRHRAFFGAQCTSQQHSASPEHEHACARLLCPALRLLRILLAISCCAACHPHASATSMEALTLRLTLCARATDGTSDRRQAERAARIRQRQRDGRRAPLHHSIAHDGKC